MLKYEKFYNNLKIKNSKLLFEKLLNEVALKGLDAGFKDFMDQIKKNSNSLFINKSWENTQSGLLDAYYKRLTGYIDNSENLPILKTKLKDTFEIYSDKATNMGLGVEGDPTKLAGQLDEIQNGFLEEMRLWLNTNGDNTKIPKIKPKSVTPTTPKESPTPGNPQFMGPVQPAVKAVDVSANISDALKQLTPGSPTPPKGTEEVVKITNNAVSQATYEAAELSQKMGKALATGQTSSLIKGFWQRIKAKVLTDLLNEKTVENLVEGMKDFYSGTLGRESDSIIIKNFVSRPIGTKEKTAMYSLVTYLVLLGVGSKFESFASEKNNDGTPKLDKDGDTYTIINKTPIKTKTISRIVRYIVTPQYVATEIVVGESGSFVINKGKSAVKWSLNKFKTDTNDPQTKKEAAKAVAAVGLPESSTPADSSPNTQKAAENTFKTKVGGIYVITLEGDAKGKKVIKVREPNIFSYIIKGKPVGQEFPLSDSALRLPSN